MPSERRPDMTEDYSSLPDELLVVVIQDGGLFAFRELVKRYETRLLFFVRRLVWDEPTAEDVVQDTFLKLYQSIHRVDPERRFSTYLFTIAKNTAISALRARRPEVTIDAAATTPGPDDLDASTDQVLRSERVTRSLAAIDPKYRQVVELYYFQHLTYEEIRARTGLPLNTIRTRLRRAKNVLRRQLNYDS